MIRYGIGWVIGTVARYVMDWPYVAFALVFAFLASDGPTWFVVAVLLSLVVVGYLTWGRQVHWAHLRRYRRIWEANAPLVGVVNRDGMAPRIADFSREDWGRLFVLELLSGHSLEQVQKAVPQLLPLFDVDLIRVERLSPSTVQLRCVTSTQLESGSAAWEGNALSIPDPMDARPTMSETSEPVSEWFTDESGELPR